MFEARSTRGRNNPSTEWWKYLSPKWNFPRIFLATANETCIKLSRKKEESDRPSHLAIMRVHSALQRVFPHGQLRKTAAIDLRGRRHGGRNGHVGFGFRARVIKFIRCVRIYSFQSAARSPVVLPRRRRAHSPFYNTVGPSGLKPASPAHLRAYGNICKNSKSNWPAGLSTRLLRGITRETIVCFTPRCIRHEPKIFFLLHFRDGNVIWKSKFYLSRPL